MAMNPAPSKRTTVFRSFAALLLVTLSTVHEGHAAPRDNAANTGFQMLEEPTNPVFIGMGSAGTALQGTGFSYYNPALPALLSARTLTGEYGQYPAGDLDRTHVETGFPLDKYFLAASFHTDAIDNITGTSVEGTILKPFTDQHSMLALAFGFRKGKRLDIAVALNSIQHRTAEYSALAASLSGGILYQAIPGRLTLGAAGFHVGTSTSMDSLKTWGEGAALPRSARVGAAWCDTLQGKYPLRVAADMVYRDTDGRIMIPAGIEVRPIDVLALRIGKRFLLETELIDLGFGLDIAPLSVDMAFMVPKLVDDTELKWLVGITYTLGRRKAVKAKPASVAAEVIAVPLQDTAVSTTPAPKSESLTQEPPVVDSTVVDSVAASKDNEPAVTDSMAQTDSLEADSSSGAQLPGETDSMQQSDSTVVSPSTPPVVDSLAQPSVADSMNQEPASITSPTDEEASEAAAEPQNAPNDTTDIVAPAKSE